MSDILDICVKKCKKSSWKNQFSDRVSRGVCLPSASCSVRWCCCAEGRPPSRRPHPGLPGPPTMGAGGRNPENTEAARLDVFMLLLRCLNKTSNIKKWYIYIFFFWNNSLKIFYYKRTKTFVWKGLNRLLYRLLTTAGRTAPSYSRFTTATVT